MWKGYTNPYLEHAAPTLGVKPAVSESGGNSRAPGNSKVGAKPQSLTPSGDRRNDTQSPSPPVSVRGPASQGQSVLASKRSVTDPSPRAINGAANLMRLHRPSHLESTKETKESGIDPRSTSPRKADGGEDWHGKYRDRQSPPGQDNK